MKKLKSIFIANALTAFVILVVPFTSNAKPVSFAFTASVDSMFEHDGHTKVNTTVKTSNFAGFTLNQGDQIFGTVTYDSDAELNPYYQPPKQSTGSYRIFESNLIIPVFNFSINSNINLSTNGTAHIQVANDASTFSGNDIFYLESSSGYDPILFMASRLYLFDNNSLAFNSGEVPDNFFLDDFYYRVFQTGWVRQSDGSQLNFSASLSSLNKVTRSVPEPPTFWLISSVIFLLIAMRKYRNKISARIDAVIKNH